MAEYVTDSKQHELRNCFCNSTEEMCLNICNKIRRENKVNQRIINRQVGWWWWDKERLKEEIGIQDNAKF